jgi:hypothetical protein
MDPAMVQRVLDLNDRMKSAWSREQGQDLEAREELKGIIRQWGSQKITEMCENRSSINDPDERCAWRVLNNLDALHTMKPPVGLPGNQDKPFEHH